MADTNKNDGGFAFPCSADDKAGWPATYGMTLRDWFAGQALTGISAHPELGNLRQSELADWAYTIADAMLAERSK